MMENGENVRTRGIHAGRVAAGAIVLGLGVLMLLQRNGPLADHAMRLFPGVVLVTIGLAKMTDAWICRQGRRRWSGVWLVAVGAWMLISETHLWGLSYHTAWPLLLVFAGVLIVFAELFPSRRTSAEQEQH